MTILSHRAATTLVVAGATIVGADKSSTTAARKSQSIGILGSDNDRDILGLMVHKANSKAALECAAARKLYSSSSPEEEEPTAETRRKLGKSSKSSKKSKSGKSSKSEKSNKRSKKKSDKSSKKNKKKNRANTNSVAKKEPPAVNTPRNRPFPADNRDQGGILNIGNAVITPAPTVVPITAPPTKNPTFVPITSPPTKNPTFVPITAPPSKNPTLAPTKSPSRRPTPSPTDRPTNKPTQLPKPATCADAGSVCSPIGFPCCSSDHICASFGNNQGSRCILTNALAPSPSPDPKASATIEFVCAVPGGACISATGQKSPCCEADNVCVEFLKTDGTTSGLCLQELRAQDSVSFVPAGTLSSKQSGKPSDSEFVPAGKQADSEPKVESVNVWPEAPTRGPTHAAKLGGNSEEGEMTSSDTSLGNINLEDIDGGNVPTKSPTLSNGGLLPTYFQSLIGFGDYEPMINKAEAESLAQLSFVNYQHKIGALGKCEGDCNRDIDCAGELKCYRRAEHGPWNVMVVPGCEAGIGHPMKKVDYCYDPNDDLEGEVIKQEPETDPTLGAEEDVGFIPDTPDELTSSPTSSPTAPDAPTSSPTSSPTAAPTERPTSLPTAFPTVEPTSEPTPTGSPTLSAPTGFIILSQPTGIPCVRTSLFQAECCNNDVSECGEGYDCCDALRNVCVDTTTLDETQIRNLRCKPPQPSAPTATRTTNSPTSVPTASPTPVPPTASPTLSPTSTASSPPSVACEPCTDNPTPWMINNNETCSTWTWGISNNCNSNSFWVDWNVCQYSCFRAGNGYGSTVCCDDVVTEDGLMEPITTLTPTSGPTTSPTTSPTASPTALVTTPDTEAIANYADALLPEDECFNEHGLEVCFAYHTDSTCDMVVDGVECDCCMFNMNGFMISDFDCKNVGPHWGSLGASCQKPKVVSNPISSLGDIRVDSIEKPRIECGGVGQLCNFGSIGNCCDDPDFECVFIAEQNGSRCLRPSNGRETDGGGISDDLRAR